MRESESKSAEQIGKNRARVARTNRVANASEEWCGV